MESGEYRRNFLLICVAQFGFALSMSVIDPLLPVYVASFEVSYSLIGLVMSAFGMTRVFVEIPGGVLSDRLGLRRLLLMGLALSMGSHILAGVAQSYAELIVSRMIVGVGSAFSMMAGMMYIGEMAPPAQRQRNIGRYQSTFSMGGILGPSLGGFISDLLGIRVMFFIAAGVTTLSMLLVLALRGSESRSSTASRVSSPRLGGMLKDPVVLALCSATFLMFFMFSSIRGTMIPLYGTDVLALTSTQIGLVFSITSSIIVVALIGVVPRLESRISGPRMLVISLLLSSFSVAVLSAAKSFPTLALTAVPLGFGFALLQPTPFAMILDMSSLENRGVMVGLLRTAGDVGIIAGPILVGGLLDIGQPSLVFYVIAAIIAFFALVSWLVFRNHAAG